MEEQVYSKEDIRDAFWRMFHESGEQWFSYLGSPKENAEITENKWNSFSQYLDKYR